MGKGMDTQFFWSAFNKHIMLQDEVVLLELSFASLWVRYNKFGIKFYFIF